MVQLRIYVSFRKALKALSDDEKGRLFDAMLAYAEDKTVSPLPGNERFLWPVVMDTLDAQHKSYDEKCENIKKGRDVLKDKTHMNLIRGEDNLSYLKVQDQIQKQKQDKLYNSRYGGKERKSNFPEHTPPTDEQLQDIFLDLSKEVPDD